MFIIRIFLYIYVHMLVSLPYLILCVVYLVLLSVYRQHRFNGGWMNANTEKLWN